MLLGREAQTSPCVNRLVRVFIWLCTTKGTTQGLLVSTKHMTGFTH